MKNILALLTIIICISCNNDGNNLNGLTPCDTTKPVIQNLLVNIETWNQIDSTQAGSFLFTSSGLLSKPFFAFGEFISPDKQIPNIEFRPQLGEIILSPIDGIITKITPKSNVDEGSEIFIRTSLNSCYRITVDHVQDIPISEGDIVKAGDIIGKPGNFQNGRGQVELQINDDHNRQYVCPLEFMSDIDKTKWQDKLSQIMEDWESVRMDTTIFDEASQNIPGCNTSSIGYDDLVN